MPPMMITMLWPSDAMASHEKFLDRLARLLRLRKVVVARLRKPKTTRNSTRATKTWPLISPCHIFPGEAGRVMGLGGCGVSVVCSAVTGSPSCWGAAPQNRVHASTSSIIWRMVATSRSFLSRKAAAPASMPSRRNSRSG